MSDQKKNAATLADKIAVSLQYDGESAPVVTAKGSGHIAEQILELAREHNIPIQQDPELVSLLSQVELNQEIPQILYEAVAQVLVFAYQLSEKSPPQTKQTPSPSS
ncbi:MAG: EscU/YscU/HrcU family type III secretion system export apparatus switch protein [Gammaproteobacteria bacterium]|jgi:flagellar biosynthesis protein|nr:EscU/YscU/HrcU family type III secretion system export apparatus switch protein [Gammaproteobacteria bacterium]MBD3775649.1 EscU/YscU/HrcU family type III secretion system export apparatus switch protein [Thiotrichales bacterium]